MSPLITSRLHSTNYSWFMEEKNRAQKAAMELYHGYKIDVGESRDLSQGLLFQNPFLILHLKSPCVHMYVFVHVCLPYCAVHTCMGGHRHVSPTARVWRSADNVTGLRQTVSLCVWSHSPLPVLMNFQGSSCFLYHYFSFLKHWGSRHVLICPVYMDSRASNSGL